MLLGILYQTIGVLALCCAEHFCTLLNTQHFIMFIVVQFRQSWLLHSQLSGMCRRLTEVKKWSMTPVSFLCCSQPWINAAEARGCAELVVFAEHPCWERKRRLATSSNALLDTNVRPSVGCMSHYFYKYESNMRMSLFVALSAPTWHVCTRFTRDENTF